ncbi:hypothetical protein Trco_005432 [Trichoderma cornu-damae]|uniref:Integral membrane protein n=1 Tax=Trichoderma cornu-damae TaxID=654480 RepID=A0A9P8TWG8_9HYPO|nr:hypothetical protein Trco_005432 [Trichoderma cornu-damae]
MKSAALGGKLASIAVLGLSFALPVIAGNGRRHGHEESEPEPAQHDDAEYPPSYMSHPEHARVLYSHIALMTLAWVIFLPVAVFLSLAKSRYVLPSQFLFLATNALGLILGTVYNTQTPDLYPNNAHHRIGWIITWVISAQVVVSLLRHIGGAFKGADSHLAEERRSFIPLAMDAPEAGNSSYYGHYRLSNDSGQGSEPTTESLHSDSASTLRDHDRRPMSNFDKELDEDEDLDGPTMPMPTPAPQSRTALVAMKVLSSKVWKYIDFGYKAVDRIILPFGFVAYITGIATFGRFFEGSAIFSGLAHWIKGGIFFWMGLLTLGRWSGSFYESGWAWNLRPQRTAGKRWAPSAEFVESALIFTYGSTNIFLEHLGSQDGVWTPSDLEHFSITVLFLGGGLCGMLVESTRMRDLLNTSVTSSQPTASDEERLSLEPPESYGFSVNPIPALIIFFLGMMMGGHSQQTMIASMIHKQWGNLLFGAAMARMLTYVAMYLKPPKSIHPSRPPTELLAAFGLISGGIVFMYSQSADTIKGIIHYNLEAMSIYTITLGFTGLLMAWELILLGMKGWAIRKERNSAHL